MNINAQAIAGVSAAALSGAATLAGLLRGPGAIRSRLRHDIDLLAGLPPESAAHANLLEHLDERITQFRISETKWRRDSNGIAVAVFLLATMGLLMWWLLGLDPWWAKALSVLPGSLIVAAIVGLFDSLQRVPRDEKGNRL